MALSVDEINALARDYITKGKVTDNYFKGNAFLMRLLRSPKPFTGGTKIREVLWHSRLNGGAYEGTGPYNTAHKEIHTAAFFYWKKYYVWVAVTGDDELTVTGPEEIVDMVQGKVRNGALTMKDYIGDDMHASSAASGGKIHSIVGDIFNETTSTAFGEIAEDDMSEWKANVYNWSGKTFNLVNMKAMRRKAKIGSELPNLYISSDDVCDAFEDLLQPSKRYESDEMARSGFDSVMFGRAPMVADQKMVYSAGSARIHGFNTNHIFMRIHTQRNFLWKPFTEVHGTDSKGAPFLFSGQTTLDSRRHHVSGKNLTI